MDREVLSSWSALIDYLRAAMGREANEQFRLLFLDRKNALIADEIQARGTVDHTPVYVREVVKRALDLGATALILVHNHPTSGFSITLDHADNGRTPAEREGGCDHAAEACKGTGLLRQDNQEPVNDMRALHRLE
jgi:hypothetical protein